MVDISELHTKIDNPTFQDMIRRVQKFIQKNKKNPKIVYIRPNGPDYVTWQRYQDMKTRWDQKTKELGRYPNYVCINPPCDESENNTVGNGIWMWASHMDQVNMEQLQRNNITNIFLLEPAFNDENKAKAFVSKAANAQIKIHAWIQCLHDSQGWHDPTDITTTQRILEKINKALRCGVYGIHLDYIRYPGNAYLYPNASSRIAGIVGKIRSSFGDKLFLSAALMPEMKANAYYYGQDYGLLGKYLDVQIPMAYKGNYQANRDWIAKVTKYIREESGKPVWTGLQTYRSDKNPTPISKEELEADMKAAMSAGALGCVLFRFGLIDKNFWR